MNDQLDTHELGEETGELLPDREVLSLLSDPTAMEVPPLLGGTETADAGAADYASGTTATASGLTTEPMPEASSSDTYSPSQTASAG